MRGKGYRQTEEHRRRISESTTGVKKTPYYGRPCSEETRRKISEAKKGNQCSLGRKLSEITKSKISESNIGRKHSEEAKRKMSKFQKEREHGSMNEDHRRRISAGLQGISLEDWEGYISYEPYCHLFNFATKERIRNQHMRTCVISGESIIQNKQRLVIHHVDNNKQQGCNGIPWRLVPVTRSWNAKLQNQQSLLLLNLLLIQNKQAEINYRGAYS